MTLILASGIGHRWISGQWGGADDDLEQAIARLETIPARMGDWSGDDMELGERQLERGRIDGYLSRRYVNRNTGNVVHLIIVCGRPGPISVHTPEVCMQGAGFGLLAEPSTCRVTAGQSRSLGQFHVGDFARQTDSATEIVRVLWGWNPGDGWKTPENPRLEYAGQSFLYKAYVSRTLDRHNDPIEGDPCVEFLKELLPHCQRAFQEGGERVGNS